MLEMCLHEKNGLFCPKCGNKLSKEDILVELSNLAKEIDAMEQKPSEDEIKLKRYQLLSKLSTCSECGEPMREVFSIKQHENIMAKKLCIYNHELKAKELDELIAIILHQNILDYEGDKYIDPNLKKDLELKNRLQNKNYSSPSLEKQLICVSISSPYTVDELKENVTLRKLSFMLKTIDAKNYYYA